MRGGVLICPPTSFSAVSLAVGVIRVGVGNLALVFCPFDTAGDAATPIPGTWHGGRGILRLLGTGSLDVGPPVVCRTRTLDGADPRVVAATPVSQGLPIGTGIFDGVRVPINPLATGGARDFLPVTIAILVNSSKWVFGCEGVLKALCEKSVQQE